MGYFIAFIIILALIVSMIRAIYFHMFEFTVGLMYLGIIAAVIYFILHPRVAKRLMKRAQDNMSHGLNPVVMESSDENPQQKQLEISVRQLQNDIAERMDESLPITSRGQEEQNHEIELLTKKINLLADQIDSLNSTESHLMTYEADSIIRPKFFKQYVNKRIEETSRIYFKEFLDYKNEVSEKKLTREQLNSDIEAEKMKAEYKRQIFDLQLDHFKADTETKRIGIYQIKNRSDADMLITQANVNFQDAQTDKEKIKANFIKDVLCKIDPTTLPAELQTYLVASVFNQNTHSYDDHLHKSKLQEIIDIKAQADIAKTNAETSKIRSDAEHKFTETDGIKTRNAQESWKLDESKKRRN